jgi:hypothetical protein
LPQWFAAGERDATPRISIESPVFGYFLDNLLGRHLFSDHSQGAKQTDMDTVKALIAALPVYVPLAPIVKTDGFLRAYCGTGATGVALQIPYHQLGLGRL